MKPFSVFFSGLFPDAEKFPETENLIHRGGMIVGFVIGIGFIVPSLYGIFDPSNAANQWKIQLVQQPAIDEYRTLSFLICSVGMLLCIGSAMSQYTRKTLFVASWLLCALLVGRTATFVAGEVTTLLIAETAIESFALLVAVVVLHRYPETIQPTADTDG